MAGKNQEKRLARRLDCTGDYFYSQSSMGKRIDCKLKNISVTGACIESPASLKQNEVIILHICRSDDFSMKAQVVWCRSKTYGLMFLLETSDDFSTISTIMNGEVGMSGEFPIC